VLLVGRVKTNSFNASKPTRIVAYISNWGDADLKRHHKQFNLWITPFTAVENLHFLGKTFTFSVSASQTKPPYMGYRGTLSPQLLPSIVIATEGHSYPPSFHMGSVEA
jgi:hypothetical protein